LAQKSTRTLIIIWLGWAALILSFQALLVARIDVVKPDNVLPWTAQATSPEALDIRPFLAHPFMNNQVAWDSEFYLAIAVDGYDTPNMRTVTLDDGRELPLAYGFMPLYPMLMRILAIPLGILGLAPVAAATLAGWLISVAATLIGVLSLYDLTRSIAADAGSDGWSMRSAYYLLIFPSAFFLAQVYTEALFIALTFASLALMHRERYGWAALLGALAVWTRATGLFIILPLAYLLIRSTDWQTARQNVLATLARFGQVALVLLSYGIWYITLGRDYSAVQQAFFVRSVEFMLQALGKWVLALINLPGANPQTHAYYIIEFTAIGLTLLASAWMMRRSPAIALYSLAGLFLAGATSQGPHSMIRYVLVAPALFIFLGYVGRDTAFDRLWSLGSTLVLALLTLLFTFNMWVA